MAGTDPKDNNRLRDNLRAGHERRINITIEDIDRFKETSDVYGKSRDLGNRYIVADAVKAIDATIPRDEESARELLAIRDALNDWLDRDTKKGYLAGHWDKIFQIRGEKRNG